MSKLRLTCYASIARSSDSVVPNLLPLRNRGEARFRCSKHDILEGANPVEKSVRYLANGAEAWIEFLGPGQKPVLPSVAQKRAEVCFKCPLNRPAKGWIDTISSAAAKATKAYFHIKDALELKVDGEERLGICNACWCPLKLKVHMPIEHIEEFTEDEVLADLHKDCWILKELV